MLINILIVYTIKTTLKLYLEYVQQAYINAFSKMQTKGIMKYYFTLVRIIYLRKMENHHVDVMWYKRK